MYRERNAGDEMTRGLTGLVMVNTGRMRSVKGGDGVAMSTNATLYCHDDVTLRLCVTQGGGGRGGSGLGVLVGQGCVT